MAEATTNDRPIDESYAQIVKRLGESQKSGRGAPAYSRFINRPLGRRFAALAYMAGMSPNGVTVISAVFTFSAITLLATVPPSVLSGVAIAVLLVVGYALDAADGQLARLTGGGSLSGEWLDHMVDCVKASALHLAVAINIFRYRDIDSAWLLIPVLLTVVSATGFFGQILGEQLKRSRQSATATGSLSPLVALLKTPTDYGVFCLTFALLGFETIFLGAYTIMAIGGTLYLVVVLPRWYGQMRALDSGGAS